MKKSGTITMEYAEDAIAPRHPDATERMPDTFRTAAGILTGILAGSAVWLALAALLLTS